MQIFETIIYKPIGWLLEQLYYIFGNYALAIFMLTMIITLALVPLNVRQQKTSAKQARLTPKINALKEKYGTDKQKYNEELNKLYTREGSNPAGGCLTMLIRLPFLLGIYSAVNSPLSYILRMPADVITKAKEALMPIIGQTNVANVRELQIVSHMEELVPKVPELSEIQGKLNFDLFGIDLTETPSFGAFGVIWIIPFLSFAVTMITTLITMRMQKKSGQQQQAGMNTTMLIMPLFSLFIAFTVPGAVGFYWACSSLASGLLQILLQKIYSANYINSKEDYTRVQKRRAYERAKLAQQSGLSEDL